MFVKQEVDNSTNWRTACQSNRSRIRALTGPRIGFIALRRFPEGSLPGRQVGTGTNLAPSILQRLTWSRRHKIDVNEE